MRLRMLRIKLKRLLIQRHLWGFAQAGLAGWLFVRSLRQRARRPLRGAAIRHYLRDHPLRKLHIGSGKYVLPGWLNTDVAPGTDRVVYLDASRRMPFANDTFDYIFSEHVIEHIDYLLSEQMLRECYRVLRPGGRIRIATPDLQFLIDLHTPEKTPVQQAYIRWSVDAFMPHIGIYRDAFVINNFFRNWGHRFVYDFATLTRALAAAGFVAVVRRAVGESDDAHLRDLESHSSDISPEFNLLETMVAEAQKPGGG
jgi:predicted SAM-dependent methyltransferase